VTAAEVMVTAGGAAAILWELWYFRPAGRPVRVRPSGVQELRIRVQGGFTPEMLVVRAGAPVRLRFAREEAAAGSARLEFATLDIRCELPPWETTVIDLPALAPGEYPFHCEGSAAAGRLVVEPADARRDPAASPHEHHV
jgi:plastocyanin domain-containing protein